MAQSLLEKAGLAKPPREVKRGKRDGFDASRFLLDEPEDDD